MHRTQITPVAIAVLAGVVLALAPAAADEPSSDPYVARKAYYEDRWQAKIESALTFVRGAVVTVNVDLSRQLEYVEESETPNGEPITLERITKSSVQSSPAPTARVASYEAEGPAGIGPRPMPRDEVKETSVRTVVPFTKATTTIAGMVPETVSVAVCVPSSYYESIWRHRAEAATAVGPGSDKPQALQQIQDEVETKVFETVSVLLPTRRNGSAPRVKVISFVDLEE